MLQELFVKIGADFKDFEKGMENAQKKLGDFGKKTEKLGSDLTKGLTAPIVGVGLAIFATAQKTGDYADRILDLEAITGMSAEAIQEWQHVAKIAGVETEAVTKAAQKLTKQLDTMEDGTGKAAEALGMLGIEFEDFIKLPVDERMEKVIKALTEIEDPAERARIGTDLLGTAWQDIAPIVALGAEEIDRARQAANDLGTVMGKDALNDANDFRIGMEELKAQMGGLFNEIGAKLAPMLTETLLPIIQNDIIPLIVKFAEKVAGLIDKFNGLDEDTKKMILTFVAILAAIGPVLMIVGKLIGVFSLILSPIGLIIAIIALLAAGFIYLYTTNEDFKKFVDNAWEAIKNAITASIEFIIDIINEHFVPVIKKIQEVFTEIFNFIKPYIKEFVEFVQSKLDDLRLFWEENGEQILQAVKNIFEFIVEVISGAIKAIMDIVDFFMPLLKDAFEVAFNFIKDTIDNVFKIISGIFKVFAGVFTGDWEKVWEGVKDIFSGIFDQIVNLFEAAFKMLIKIGEFLIKPFKDIFEKAIDFITELFAKFNPLEVITKNWNAIKEFFTNLFNSIRDKIVSIFDGIVSKITGAIQTIRSAIDGVLSFFKSTKDTIDNFTSGAKSGISSAATNIKDKIGNVVGKIPFLADGGIIKSPTLAMIGERGAEAVIPLDRMNDFSGVHPVNVYLDGRKITGTIAPQMVDMIRGRIGSAY
jgi:phage-related minor tail protein